MNARHDCEFGLWKQGLAATWLAQALGSGSATQISRLSKASVACRHSGVWSIPPVGQAADWRSNSSPSSLWQAATSEVPWHSLKPPWFELFALSFAGLLLSAFGSGRSAARAFDAGAGAGGGAAGGADAGAGAGAGAAGAGGAMTGAGTTGAGATRLDHRRDRVRGRGRRGDLHRHLWHGRRRERDRRRRDDRSGCSAPSPPSCAVAPTANRAESARAMSTAWRPSRLTPPIRTTASPHAPLLVSSPRTAPD